MVVYNRFIDIFKERRKLYSKTLNKSSDQNITTFKNYNNLFNKLTRIMTITYFKTSIEENKLNTKKT